MAMTSAVDRLAAIDEDDNSSIGPLRLRRSWPRGEDKLLVEYERADGSTIAGQWYADPERGREVAETTPGSTWLSSRRVVLQPGGCDRRLPRLSALVAEHGATLLVHRPERRAVVKRAGCRYVKVLPSKKAARALDADRAARDTGVIDMPELLYADVDSGVLEWAEAPGRSLYDLLHDASVPLAQIAAAAGAAGTSLRAMHRAPVPAGLGHHGSDAEADAAAFWLRGAAEYSTSPNGAVAMFAAANADLSSGTSATVLIHRDLHEKQVLVDGEHATLIDLDTLACGEAALDVANFLVHLDLRVSLGLAADRAEAAAAEFLTAYRPSPEVVHRIPAHAAMARVRLACLYAFRPDQAEGAARLVTERSAGSLATTAVA